MLTEQQAIRKILDAATANDLSLATETLNKYADQRNVCNSLVKGNISTYGQQMMFMEEHRSRLPINQLP